LRKSAEREVQSFRTTLSLEENDVMALRAHMECWRWECSHEEETMNRWRAEASSVPVELEQDSLELVEEVRDAEVCSTVLARHVSFNEAEREREMETRREKVRAASKRCSRLREHHRQEEIATEFSFKQRFGVLAQRRQEIKVDETATERALQQAELELHGHEDDLRKTNVAVEGLRTELERNSSIQSWLGRQVSATEGRLMEVMANQDEALLQRQFLEAACVHAQRERDEAVLMTVHRHVISEHRALVAERSALARRTAESLAEVAEVEAALTEDLAPRARLKDAEQRILSLRLDFESESEVMDFVSEELSVKRDLAMTMQEARSARLSDWQSAAAAVETEIWELELAADAAETAEEELAEDLVEMKEKSDGADGLLVQFQEEVEQARCSWTRRVRHEQSEVECARAEGVRVAEEAAQHLHALDMELGAELKRRHLKHQREIEDVQRMREEVSCYTAERHAMETAWAQERERISHEAMTLIHQGS